MMAKPALRAVMTPEMEGTAAAAPHRTRRGGRGALRWLLLLVCVVAACGGESGTAPPTPTASPTLTPTPTSTLTPTPTPVPTATLRDCRRPEADCTLAETATQAGFWVGAAIADPAGAAEQAVVPRHFNSIVAEDSMKWGSLAPRVGQYDFAAADAIADFAARSGVRLRGHTLLWRDQQPADLAEQVAAAVDPAQHLRALIEQHFTAVLPRYRGRVAQWDVVNEPLEVGRGVLDANLFYRTLGPGYIADAFRLARQLDPEAALCLNEFLLSHSADDGKALGLAALVRDLRADGVPVDVVGLQGHFFGFLNIPTQAEWERLLRLFTDLGVRVELTQVDVSLRSFDGDPEPLGRQAEAYAALAAACLAVPGCEAITVWGIDDSRTWLDRFPPFSTQAPHFPLLLDAGLAPKPAYFAVRDAVARR